MRYSLLLLSFECERGRKGRREKKERKKVREVLLWILLRVFFLSSTDLLISEIPSQFFPPFLSQTHSFLKPIPSSLLFILKNSNRQCSSFSLRLSSLSFPPSSLSLLLSPSSLQLYLISISKQKLLSVCLSLICRN